MSSPPSDNPFCGGDEPAPMRRVRSPKAQKPPSPMANAKRRELETELLFLRSKVQHLHHEMSVRMSIPTFTPFSPYSTLNNKPLSVADLIAHHPTFDDSQSVELRWHCAGGNYDAVHKLILAGVSVNCQDYDGLTPLHIAAMRGHKRIVQLLLEHGAEPRVEDRTGRSACDLAAENGFDAIAEVFIPVLERINFGDVQDLGSWNFTPMSASVGSDGGGQLRSGTTALGRVVSMMHREDRSSGRPSTPSPGPPLLASSFSQLRTPMLPLSQAQFDPTPSQGAQGVFISSDFDGFALITVGLPGRGKTFMAQRINRFLAWVGIKCKSFSTAKHRKAVIPHATSRIDRLRKATDEDEERIAKNITMEIRDWKALNPEGIAIIDGTNLIRARRKILAKHLRSVFFSDQKLVFLEVSVTDDRQIMKNILQAQQELPPSEAGGNFVEGYLKSVADHQEVYDSLNLVDDDEISLIKLENNQHITLHRIENVVISRIVFFLTNLHPVPFPIYLTSSGEWEDLVHGRLGGNSQLTRRGEAYSLALAQAIQNDVEEPLLVLSSTMTRSMQTSQHFDPSRCTFRSLPQLHSQNLGDCEGMLLGDVQEQLPNTLLQIQKDPYNVSWPSGESVHSMILGRLEDIIHYIHASDRPVVVVSHTSVTQCLLVYFAHLQAESAPRQVVPLHTVIKISPGEQRPKVSRLVLEQMVDEIIAKGTGGGLASGRTGSSSSTPCFET